MTNIPLSEYARRHERTPDSARQMALRGGFKTALKAGTSWMIDENEPYPDHRRRKLPKERCSRSASTKTTGAVKARED